MTLSTKLYIHDPVDRVELHAFCNKLVGGEAGTRKRVTDTGISNEPAQGLAAWLLVDANADGTPYRPEPEPHWDDCEPDCESTHDPAAFAVVDFDTGYAYKGPNGESCTVLHASYIVDLAAWFAERNVSWSWRNEYNSEIHQGADPEGLREFMGHGDEAAHWFTTVVQPRIPLLAARVEAGQDPAEAARAIAPEEPPA